MKRALRGRARRGAEGYTPARPTTKCAQAATDLASDRFIAYSTWKWADLQAKTGGKPVYRYFYARPRPAMVAAMGNAVPGLAGGVISGANAPATRPPAARGAVHSAEIEYAMGNLATQQGLRMDARRLQGLGGDAGVLRQLRQDRRSERPGPAEVAGGERRRGLTGHAHRRDAWRCSSSSIAPATCSWIRSTRRRRSEAVSRAPLTIPKAGAATLDIGGREVRLTNLDKPFWPEHGITKGDLIQYYADVAAVLLPHVSDRAMVMKRYPHGAGGDFFFMKRAPVAAARVDAHLRDRARVRQRHRLPRRRGRRVAALGHQPRLHRPEPVVRDAATMSTGPITCTSISIPARARRWDRVLAAARIVHDALDSLEDAVAGQDDGLEGAARLRADRARPGAEGSLDVREGARRRARRAHPALMTAEYKVAKRRAGRVLVDYNQNAWGRTLASVLLGAAATACARLHSGHLGRDRGRRSD